LLIVSPRLGDAASSCAALLERVDPVTVLDVFTLVPEPDRSTEWDRTCGFSSANDAMAAREQEEAAAFAETFHDVLAVDLLDGRYRDDLHGIVDERRLRDALEGWVSRSGACTVALPAGAGLAAGAGPGIGARLRSLFGGPPILHADPDHLWVRDVVIRVLHDHPQVALWLYDELPHAMSKHADATVALVAQWVDRRAEPRTLRVDRVAKAKRLGAYRSQLSSSFRVRSPRRLVRRLPRVERYWVLEPVTS
jgi:hypothetical protein